MKEKLAKLYSAQNVTPDSFAPSYNVAPTEPAPIIIENSNQIRELLTARFGIPMAIGAKKFPLLNIQSEKASNREDLKTRRCIIPANGFYEWEAITSKDKQPHYYSPKDGIFSLAGIWKQNDKGLYFTILTTTANELLMPIHGRMPVILGHNGVSQWLAPDSDKETITSLMQPYSAGLMQEWKVSKLVNSSKHKDAACINSL